MIVRDLIKLLEKCPELLDVELSSHSYFDADDTCGFYEMIDVEKVLLQHSGKKVQTIVLSNEIPGYPENSENYTEIKE